MNLNKDMDDHQQHTYFHAYYNIGNKLLIQLYDLN